MYVGVNTMAGEEVRRTIAAAITEVLNDSLENVANAFVSKSGAQKVILDLLFDC